MEHRAYLDRIMKFQSVGVRGDPVHDSEGSMAPMIQFRRRPACFPILGVEPHEVSRLVVWGWDTMLVGNFLITKLDAIVYLWSHVVMDLGQGLYW
jgi:hypothetical protein